MKNRIRILLIALIDVVVPTVGYFLLHALGVEDIWALTVAGSAAGALTVLQTIRRRRIDPLGVLVFAELVLSIVLTVLTDDPRLVLIRAALYVAVGGAFTLASGLLRRPLTYTAAAPMAHKGDPARAAAYAAAWENSPQLRRIHQQLSVTIGAATVAYAALRVVLIYQASSVAEAVWLQEVPGLILIVGAVVLIRLRVPALRRIVDAEQARLVAGPHGSRPADEPARLGGSALSRPGA